MTSMNCLEKKLIGLLAALKSILHGGPAGNDGLVLLADPCHLDQGQSRPIFEEQICLCEDGAQPGSLANSELRGDLRSPEASPRYPCGVWKSGVRSGPFGS